MLLRAKKKEQGDVSLNESIGTDKEGNQIMLIDVMSNDEEDIFDEINTSLEVKQLYRNIRKELDPREREVIVMRYGLIDGDVSPSGRSPKPSISPAPMYPALRRKPSQSSKRASATKRKYIEPALTKAATILPKIPLHIAGKSFTIETVHETSTHLEDKQ